MNKLILSFCLFFSITILFNGCAKKKGWDEKLNGTWTQIDPTTNQPLNGSYYLKIDWNEHFMTRYECANGSPFFTNPLTPSASNEKLVAYKKQLYIVGKPRLAKGETKTRYAYLFDYEFDGDYIWLLNETTEQVGIIKNSPNAIKLMKL